MSALWYAAPTAASAPISGWVPPRPPPVSEGRGKHEGSPVQDENTTSAPDFSHFKNADVSV